MNWPIFEALGILLSRSDFSAFMASELTPAPSKGKGCLGPPRWHSLAHAASPTPASAPRVLLPISG